MKMGAGNFDVEVDDPLMFKVLYVCVACIRSLCINPVRCDLRLVLLTSALLVELTHSLYLFKCVTTRSSIVTYLYSLLKGRERNIILYFSALLNRQWWLRIIPNVIAKFVDKKQNTFLRLSKRCDEKALNVFKRRYNAKWKGIKCLLERKNSPWVTSVPIKNSFA